MSLLVLKAFTSKVAAGLMRVYSRLVAQEVLIDIKASLKVEEGK